MGQILLRQQLEYVPDRGESGSVFIGGTETPT
jgi:hypothetical protein